MRSSELRSRPEANNQQESKRAAGRWRRKTFLVHGGADALRHTAISLAVHHHRIDDGSAVLDDDVVENFNVAELGIDRNHGGVRGIAEGAGIDLGPKADGGLKATDIDVGRRRSGRKYQASRNLTHRNRTLRSDNRAVLIARGCDGALHEMRADRNNARDAARCMHWQPRPPP